MEERLWLHAACRFHRPTCQLAGPHCRAYRHDTTGAVGSKFGWTLIPTIAACAAKFTALKRVLLTTCKPKDDPNATVVDELIRTLNA